MEESDSNVVAATDATAETGPDPIDPGSQGAGPVEEGARNGNPRQNGQNVRRIRIRQGTGSVRLSFNGRGVSINGGGGTPIVDGFGSINDPRRHGHRNGRQQAGLGLPRLEPQVLPDSQQQQQEHQHNNEEFGAFKCAICYDIMKDPSGCGKCSARFCYGCLTKVAQSRTANDNLRCPMCRSPFETENIQRDVSLRRRMEEAPPIACRYEDCDALCPLTQISEHEASCPHVKIQCRFKAFGCSWTGKRGELSEHEANDCYLAKVSGLVDRQRQMQSEYSHRLAHLQQSVAATGGMLEVQRMRERQQICSSNLFHMAQFVHMLTCCTPHFLLTKDTWAPFHVHLKGRAKVSNCVSLIPTFVFLFKTIGSAYMHVLLHATSSFETDDHVLDFVDAVLNFLITSCLAIILSLSFFVDGGSSDQWKPLPLPNWAPRWLGDPSLGSDNTTNILQYGVTLAFAVVFAFILEMYGSLLRAILLWVFLFTSSTIFPSLLISMSELVNNPPGAIPPTAEKVLSTGRALKPLLFGLRYGPLVAAFGPLPCLDAAILVYQGQDMIKRVSPNLVFDHGTILSKVPTPAFYFYAGARLGLKAMASETIGLAKMADFVVVALLLLGSNFLLQDIVRSGIQLGAKIVTTSRTRVTIAASGLTVDYNGMGVASLSVWMLLIAGIAIT